VFAALFSSATASAPDQQSVGRSSLLAVVVLLLCSSAVASRRPRHLGKLAPPRPPWRNVDPSTALASPSYETHSPCGNSGRRVVSALVAPPSHSTSDRLTPRRRSGRSSQLAVLMRETKPDVLGCLTSLV